MKLGLQILSWVSVVIGILAIVGGLSELNSDPTSAYYAMLGGLLYGVQGALSLIYINEN